MKTIKGIIAVLILASMPALATAQENKAAQQDKNLVTVTYSASITCENCVNTIMNNLPKEKGVKNVSTSLENKTVTVTFQKDKNDAVQLKRAIEKLGYTAKPLPAGVEKK